MQKELLIYFLNARAQDGFCQFLGSLPPLPFEQNATYEYLKAMPDITKGAEILDELETICEDQPMKKDRLEALEMIDNASAYNFGEDDDLGD